MATLRWVDWFNNHRLFGPIGYIPPAEAEAKYYAALENCQSASKRDPLSACKRGPLGGVALGLITGTDFALGLA